METIDQVCLTQNSWYCRQLKPFINNPKTTGNTISKTYKFVVRSQLTHSLLLQGITASHVRINEIKQLYTHCSQQDNCPWFAKNEHIVDLTALAKLAKKNSVVGYENVFISSLFGFAPNRVKPIHMLKVSLEQSEVPMVSIQFQQKLTQKLASNPPSTNPEAYLG